MGFWDDLDEEMDFWEDYDELDRLEREDEERRKKRGGQPKRRKNAGCLAAVLAALALSLPAAALILRL